MTLETLHTILEVAVRAPSGHNYQPWSFSFDDNELSVHIHTERDPTIYDYKDRGSMVAIGAVVESISIVALEHGFQTQETFSHDPEGDDDVVARIRFKEEPLSHKSELTDALLARHTNRKQYEAREIPEEVLSSLKKEVHDPRVTLHIAASDIEIKKSIATAAVAADRMILSHPGVKASIFPHVVWSKEEEGRIKEGLLVDTLELDPPAKIAFSLFARYEWLSWLAGRLGFGAVIASDNTRRYVAGGEFMLLTIPDTSSESFFALGRQLLRVWAHATAEGLSVQPIGAMLYMAARAADASDSTFSESEGWMLQAAKKDLLHAFGLSEYEEPGLLLRVGYAKPPSAISSRKEPHLRMV